ncbi:MAG: hypothetical protein M3436_20110 [Pseudomonadota bacterium]|nr:hypothetical protein [Pseudomonadota bacterium]
MSIEAVHPPTYSEEVQALQKDAEIARLSAHLKILQEQLNLLAAKRFGPSSEKAHPDQIRLFNEARSGCPRGGRGAGDDRDPRASTPGWRP